MAEGEKLTLKSSQGEIFEVEPEVACMSTLIKNMVEDSGTDEEIPLPNVKTAILSKVIDYCKYHKENPAEEIQKPLKSTNLVECGVSEWDNECAPFTLLEASTARYVNIEQEARGKPSLREAWAACAGSVRADSGCELFGHQELIGPDLCQGCLHDQRQEH